MSTEEESDYFIICATHEIERGNAKAFSLSRLDENGEGRPFPIFVVRTKLNQFYAYHNSCPHEGIWLNFGAGEFFDTNDWQLLKCGRHGAKFEVETGVCVEGPCKDQKLQQLKLAVIEGDVCLSGIKLAEDDSEPDPFADEYDETMEIMIHPD